MDTASGAELYLDMVKRCVINIPYVDAEINPIQPYGRLRTVALSAAARFGVQLAHRRRGDYRKRLAGHDHSDIAHSMISMARLDNLQQCVEGVLDANVPGDLIETGVMRGGAVILMRAVLKAHGVHDRVVWAADSFEGLPAPNTERYPQDADADWHLRPLTEVSVDHVRRNFQRYGLLDDQVKFLVGWFRDTLPTAPLEHIAVLRLDGDLYESTMDALTPLYPKVSTGGYVIVDDYNLPMCKKAVDDFRRANGITEELVPIDDAAVYWRRAD
jgi:Macrocin-O-methyltransferase (TylF)